MKLRHKAWLFPVTALLLFLASRQALAQACYTADDMPEATKASLTGTATRYFQLAQQGNATALQSHTDFQLGDVLEGDKPLLSGQPIIRSVFLLDNTQASAGGAGQRAEFYCGIYNSPDRVGFVFNGLPAGQFGIVIEDVAGATPAVVTWILRQSAGAWNVAGFYVKAAQIGGHDANWYLNQARAYRTKGQTHNAWFYYLAANDMLRPFPSMSTPTLDKLYDEMQAARPGDLPYGNPVDLALANGRTVKVTQIFPTPVGDNLDLVVKYQSPDISDSSKTFQDNMAVIKALVTKYPELRDAFAGVVARAVAPNGQDYGSLLAMKDVK